LRVDLHGVQQDAIGDRLVVADLTPTRTSASPRSRAAIPNPRPTADGQRWKPTRSGRSAHMGTRCSVSSSESGTPVCDRGSVGTCRNARGL